MDAGTKRKITLGVRKFLHGANLDVTTMRHVISHLTANGVPDTREARRYVRAAVSTYLQHNVDAPWVVVRLVVDRGGVVRCGVGTR